MNRCARYRRPLGGWLLVVACLLATDAQAGSCHEVTRAQAEAAVASIASSGYLIRFCDRCGQAAPETVQVQSLALVPAVASVVVEGERFSDREVRAARQQRRGRAEAFLALFDAGDPGAREFLIEAMETMLAEQSSRVRINGAVVDLARLYYRKGEGLWANLGRAAGCTTGPAWLEWPRDPLASGDAPSRGESLQAHTGPLGAGLAGDHPQTVSSWPAD